SSHPRRGHRAKRVPHRQHSVTARHVTGPAVWTIVLHSGHRRGLPGFQRTVTTPPRARLRPGPGRAAGGGGPPPARSGRRRPGPPHAAAPGGRCGRSCCARGTGGACRGSNGQSRLPPGLVCGRVRGVLRAVLAPTRPDLAAVVPAHLRRVSLAQAVLGHEVGHLGARWADHRTAPWVVRSVTGASHSTGHRYGFGPAP